MKTKLATFSLIISGLLFMSHNTFANDKPFAIAIHGGAGTISKANLTPEQRQAYKDKLKEAVDKGSKVLEEGGDSLVAVQTAINILENSPLFNAGIGAVYTYDGGHELDASIMDGKTMNAGAVAGVRHIANPIDLALAVMNKSEHVILSGAGAEEFALTQGFSLVPNSHFDTDERYQQLLDARQKLQAAAKSEQVASVEMKDLDYKFGTVGAVALDKNGNLAAGTSTGGMTAKRFGRIGDSPVIGAGTYAENGVCAVSATGHGEFFIRYQVAGDICAKVKYQQKSIIQAADEVINQRLITAGGSGGVIAVDQRGNIATPFNTEGMYRATRSNGEPAQVLIWQDQ
ncbi:isoaspartyl peptidase/L-asparaginase [Shewanella baltica]|uniref:isoaspartyl peptidase/L-asparaginase family protein n=1 Tax=Shewanella baltica TaxID=62322 RepID=UPI00217E0D29|nr:isoaspartyl peptidase/L-asparaginase [Shewanella baltica]MCS6126879.1 isoaspartyl peptidase/L-asparaginase [Shewanella baltica]MCS6138952.1 isoaspartyl peptidase/L-asparaginase [Shewanella baltica]MCS6145141.1 isoaspartyl peptidase/L-asparaginase [Shewanella baltica]MCS6169671.1 isoaspartyl peptidase/L-asparaginase [Shewanella baltica]MCS6186895.1 isoaspartyl peptidase/L-asparaginase [Shewanella baltica]